MPALNVAWLTGDEIGNAARELLSKFQAFEGQPLGPPISVEAIIERYLKLDLGFCDLRGLLGLNDVLGATWFDEARIRVDSSLEGQHGRATFTMGHEVGHWWLHRPQYEADKLTLPLVNVEKGAQSSGIVCRARARKERAEWQADEFAAHLLMPDRLVREVFLRAFGDPVALDGLAQAQSAGESLPRWADLAAQVIAGGFSNVSNEAMRYRLVTLRLVTDAAQQTLDLR